MSRVGWRRALQWGLAGLCALGALPSEAAPEEKSDIGRQMEKEYGVVVRTSSEGQRLNDQLARVVGRTTTATGYKLKSARLLGGADAKHDKVVNAFALPDGRIYVTLGLARAVQTAADPDAELAFVVGHELSHVVLKHGEDQQKNVLSAGVAAILLGAAVKNRAASTIAGAGAAAYVSHFSREDEYQADRNGLKAMNRAGYNLDAAVSMLKRLQSLSGAQPNPTLNGWFGSHPLAQNRVNRIQEQIARIRARGGKTGTA